MAMAIALLPNEKLDEGFDEVRSTLQIFKMLLVYRKMKIFLNFWNIIVEHGC